jgi:prepilin-type N-terminal cleavage/methylation domain-containing protein
MPEQTSRGFTLLELLLSVALVGIVFGMSVVLYQNVPYQNDLDIAVQSAREVLLEASRYAAASYDDSEWGAYFMTGSATLFKGSSYNTRDVSFDETVDLSGIAVSGSSEYVFNKKTGYPIEMGVTMFTAPATGENITIDVNEKARIEIQ